MGDTIVCRSYYSVVLPLPADAYRRLFQLRTVQDGHKRITYGTAGRRTRASDSDAG